MTLKDNVRLTPEQKAHATTLGADVGNIEHGRQMRWTIHDDSDIAGVAEDVERAFVSIVLPYIDKYANLANAFELLSSDDQETTFQCPIAVERAKAAVALAVLLHKGPKEINELIGRKTAFLEAHPQFKESAVPEFLRFVESLGLGAPPA